MKTLNFHHESTRMKRLYIVLMILFPALHGFSQVVYTLSDFESRFLKNNLLLLASRYNVSASNAIALQARLWENPVFSAQFNAINPQDHKVFDIGNQGEKAFAIQQIIHIGGQKTREYNFQLANSRIAQLELEDLLRNLKFQLRQNFFTVYFDRLSVKALDQQIDNLKSLIDAFDSQAQKGNIAYKDVLRLQSLYIGLKNDRAQILDEVFSSQQTLSTLIGDSTGVEPGPTATELSVYALDKSFTLDSLQSLALLHRPDLQQADKAIDAGNWNLKWQRSLATPDLTAGFAYDQLGGTFRHEVNFTVALPLVLWNRNQGNVRAAQAQVEQARVTRDFRQLALKNEVMNGYFKFLEALHDYRNVYGLINSNTQSIYESVYQNFKKRNISLIEFTDFIESYCQSLIHYNQSQKALATAGEELNLITGTNLF